MFLGRTNLVEARGPGLHPILSIVPFFAIILAESTIIALYETIGQGICGTLFVDIGVALTKIAFTKPWACLSVAFSKITRFGIHVKGTD